MLSSVDQMHDFDLGDVLVADMTAPGCELIMKRAAAVVTDRGGRTRHTPPSTARALGIPAVVGAGSATTDLTDGRHVPVPSAEGDVGLVYEGIPDFTIGRTDLSEMPAAPVKITTHRDSLEPQLREEICERIAAYPGPRELLVQRVAEGVATIAAAFAPQPVIVRMSDLKSNEYAHLLGDEDHEPHQENPVLGCRGASRHLSAELADRFTMECEALRCVRDEMGLTNGGRQTSSSR